jgi:hypothetical protein
MYTGIDFCTAAHKHTFYICSVSEGEKGLFSTEISIKGFGGTASVFLCVCHVIFPR